MNEEGFEMLEKPAEPAPSKTVFSSIKNTFKSVRAGFKFMRSESDAKKEAALEAKKIQEE